MLNDPRHKMKLATFEYGFTHTNGYPGTQLGKFVKRRGFTKQMKMAPMYMAIKSYDEIVQFVAELSSYVSHMYLREHLTECRVWYDGELIYDANLSDLTAVKMAA